MAQFSFCRSGKSWNLSTGDGKSLEMTKSDFPKNNKAKNSLNE